MNIIAFQRYTLHKPFLFFLLLFAFSTAGAQLFPTKNYPKGYFIYPVDARISLAANFGELRANHYHMGLDCRTNQVINRPVKAAADGYIARISIAPFGFGQAIYINHPNGLTTVYGHLHSFMPELEKYIKEKQYEQQSWRIDLELPASLFPVKQGQLIARSGSTGGSQGPHCHFEIRDTRTGKVLNPLLFGLPIPDKAPPSLVSLYMYDRCKSTYSQVPKHLPIKKVGNHYVTTQTLIPILSDKISFGISANDKQSGSNNPNGIYEAVIYLDGLPLSGFELDSITYDETRYVNANIDYRTRMSGGPYIQHLSRLPGCPPGAYRDFNGDGVIELQDNKIHQVRIVVKDPDNNTSTLEFRIQKGKIIENGDPGDATSYTRGKEFHPGFVNVFENEQLRLYLPPSTLYDSVAFTYAQKESAAPDIYSNIHSVLTGLIPAQDYFTIRIKATKEVPETLRDKILIRRSWKGSSEVVKASRDGDWYSAHFRSFGDFVLIADDQPPVIHADFHDNANIARYHNIIITPRDNNDALSDFRADLDGRWLRFSNDKGRKYIYTFDEKCPRGKHELKIMAEDVAGNITRQTLHFTR